MTCHMPSLLALFTVLTKKPSEIDLDNISKNVGGNWRSLLTHLGVPSDKCKALLQESCGSTESACFQGLVFWREGNKPCKKASWSVLLEALKKGAQRGDYVEELRREIIDSATRCRNVHWEGSNRQGKMHVSNCRLFVIYMHGDELFQLVYIHVA